MKMTITDRQFWMLRGILEREVSGHQEHVRSCRQWKSPALAAFEEALKERETLLAQLDALHPLGAEGVARCVAVGKARAAA